jgi:hypothetical protein
MVKESSGCVVRNASGIGTQSLLPAIMGVAAMSRRVISAELRPIKPGRHASVEKERIAATKPVTAPLPVRFDETIVA